MKRKELIKSVVVAGAVFTASTMLFGCAYGPAPAYYPEPASTVTEQEMAAIGLDEMADGDAATVVIEGTTIHVG